jgi:predicted dehydrogenase
LPVVAGRRAAAAPAPATRWGWAEASDDWRAVIARDDIDIVDVVTPGDSHAEIAIAALEAGKHVLCEKPLANSVAEAEAMTAAADAAFAKGVVAMVGFTYRRVPAVQLARQLVTGGRIGRVQQVRAAYLQDWLADPESPLTWRLDKELAGSGSLGDIGAHAIDLSEFVTGMKLASVSGTLETLVSERPVLAESSGLGGKGGTERGPVTVDDVALIVGRYDSGVLGTFEATRFATGRKNALRLEVSGTTGAIAFDLEEMNSLQFYDATAPEGEQGFRRIQVTEPSHPYVAAWWPPGHILGYEHGFSHQVVDFVGAIAGGTQPEPSFADGLHVQRALAAVEASSGAGSAWTTV